MPLTLNTYEVWINTPGRVLTKDTPPDHLVTPRSGDQMRAELEAKRLQLPSIREAPINSTCLWIWAAMAREGLTDLPAVAFMADPPEFEAVKDETGEAVDTPVDPTRAAGGGLDYALPAATDHPSSG